MDEQIPWLNTADLVEEDEAPAHASLNEGSLAPVELAAPVPAAYDIPRTSARMWFAALGGGLSALLGVFVYSQWLAPTSHRTTAAAAPSSVAAPVPAPVSTSTSTSTSIPAPQRETPVAAHEPPVPSLHDEGPKALPPTAAPQSPTASSRPAHDDGAELRRAFASLNAGHPDDAVRRARAIVERAPRRADAWLLLGSAYDALNDHDSARQAFRACEQRGKGASVKTCAMLAGQ